MILQFDEFEWYLSLIWFLLQVVIFVARGTIVDLYRKKATYISIIAQLKSYANNNQQIY